MWGLLKLLFSAGYWRLVTRGETWRATGLALRRVHKDRRARQQVARTMFLLLVPVSVVAVAVGMTFAVTGGAGFAVVWGFLLFMGLLSRVGFGKRSEHRQPDTVQALGLSGGIGKQVARTPELRRELGELCLLHAVLADRAGSEQFVKTKELPEGVEVVTRRLHLEVLRTAGVYDRLGMTERKLILLPDGHWPEVSVNEGSLLLEPLRLFRWVLRIDKFLPTVGATLQADYRLAGTLIAEPELVSAGGEWVAMSDMKTALTAARTYFYRCWAEGSYRGFYSADDEEKREALRLHALECNGKESDDLLLGAAIVSRAEDSDVRLATTLALRRMRILEWVQGRLEGSEPALEEIRVLYPPLSDWEMADSG